MNLQEINQILEDGPARKGRYFEVFANAELEEKKAKADAYLNVKVKYPQATIKELESRAEKDEEYILAQAKRIIAERDFLQAKDELEATYEIARNARAEMRNIEPQVFL